MTPFEAFFDGEFQRRLQTAKGEPGLFSNGGRLEDASWDRRAAYLLWVQLNPIRGPLSPRAVAQREALEVPGDEDDDLLGGVAVDDEDEDLLG